MKKSIPPSMQPLFWSKSVSSLDTDKDKPYIIHHALNYGDMEHIKWLEKTYSSIELNEVFLHNPMKIYYPSTLHFVKNYVLKLNNQHIDDSKYLKTTPRNI